MKSKIVNLITYVIIPFLIFAISAYFVRSLFTIEFLPWTGSIESAFITDAKWISENFHDLWWSPLWYTGFAFYRVYPPVIPFGSALVHFASGLSFVRSYRILTAFLYCLGPVSLYFLVYFLTKRVAPAVLSALLIMLPSVSAVLFPDVQQELLMGKILVPKGLVSMVQYGEGPHISGLALVPLAILFFLRALRNPTLVNHALAALVMTGVAFTNPLAVLTAALINCLAWLTEAAVGNGRQKLKSGVLIFLLTFGFASFWYSLPYLGVIFSWGEKEAEVNSFASGGFPMLILSIFFILFIFLLCNKKPRRQPLVLGVLWVGLFSAVFYVARRWGISIFPQVGRYVPELDMGISLLAGVVLAAILNVLPSNWILQTVVGGAVVILAGFYLSGYGLEYHKAIYPHPDITRSSEYRVAKFLEETLSDEERAYVTGSNAFWLNVFSDVSQVRGGADGGAYGRWWAHAVHQINSSENAPKGEEGRVAHLWLRALNISYIVVNLPNSLETYHDYKKPGKFEDPDLFEEVYDEHGDRIYKVLGLKNPSFAQVVTRESFESLVPLKNGVDVENLEGYVAYVDGGVGNLEIVRKGNSQYQAEGEFGEGEGLSVQVGYSPGWHAYVDGEEVPVKKDAVDFIYFEVPAGNREVVMKFRPEWSVYLGWGMALATAAGLVFYKLKFGEIHWEKNSSVDEDEDY